MCTDILLTTYYYGVGGTPFASKCHFSQCLPLFTGVSAVRILRTARFGVGIRHRTPCALSAGLSAPDIELSAACGLRHRLLHRFLLKLGVHFPVSYTHLRAHETPEHLV